MRRLKKKSKNIVNRLDRMFSEFIRLSRNLTCERCGKKYAKLCTGIQTAHIISRRHYNTRWHERNAFCLCAGCHIYFHGHPHEFNEFVLKHRTDEEMTLLRGLANEKWHGDFAVVELYLKQKLNELKSVLY